MAKRPATEPAESTEPTWPQPTDGREPVTLLKPHTHGGVIYPVGTILNLLPRQAKALRAEGVA